MVLKTNAAQRPETASTDGETRPKGKTPFLLVFFSFWKQEGKKTKRKKHTHIHMYSTLLNGEQQHKHSNSIRIMWKRMSYTKKRENIKTTTDKYH
jgi:hypothetical protein